MNKNNLSNFEVHERKMSKHEISGGFMTRTFCTAHLLIIQSFQLPKTFTNGLKMQINETKLEAKLKNDILKWGLRRSYF